MARKRELSEEEHQKFLEQTRRNMAKYRERLKHDPERLKVMKQREIECRLNEKRILELKSDKAVAWAREKARMIGEIRMKRYGRKN